MPKSDVETVDHSVERSIRRWPLALFCDVLDLACLNAFALYCKILHNLKGKKKLEEKIYFRIREGISETPNPKNSVASV